MLGIYWSFRLRNKQKGDVIKDIDSRRENTTFFAEVLVYQCTCKDVKDKIKRFGVIGIGIEPVTQGVHAQ
jgi:hypothetical protein